MRLVVILIATLALSPARAAEKYPPFDDAIAGTPAALLASAEVAKELKLTDRAVGEIRKAVSKVEDKYDAGVKGLTTLEQAKAREAYRKLTADLIAEANLAAVAGLDVLQTKRFKQIELQSRGPAAFDDADVSKALALTDGQKKKLLALKDEFDRKLGKMTRQARGIETEKTIPGTALPQAGQDALTGVTPAALRRDYALQAKNVLSGDQLAKWYDLVGDPFPKK